MDSAERSGGVLNAVAGSFPPSVCGIANAKIIRLQRCRVANSRNQARELTLYRRVMI